jgi:hypothetical protein
MIVNDAVDVQYAMLSRVEAGITTILIIIPRILPLIAPLIQTHLNRNPTAFTCGVTFIIR